MIINIARLQASCGYLGLKCFNFSGAINSERARESESFHRLKHVGVVENIPSILEVFQFKFLKRTFGSTFSEEIIQIIVDFTSISSEENGETMFVDF